jgi:hypothetical protein
MMEVFGNYYDTTTNETLILSIQIMDLYFK